MDDPMLNEYTDPQMRQLMEQARAERAAFVSGLFSKIFRRAPARRTSNAVAG
jgi:hypothetical protein